MKALITLLLSTLIIGTGNTQENNIETKSVDIDNLISFVVGNYSAEELEDRNITFLIQVKQDELNGENLILLRQGFKLISERLSQESKLTIATYSKFNGIALQPTNAKEEKLILHTLNDLKGSIAEFYSDGINLAYQHADQNYEPDMANTLVMIRASHKAKNEIVNVDNEEKKLKKKQKNKALLVTALALLPELINVIKD